MKSIKPLLGGISTLLWTIQISTNGTTEEIILREYTDLKWLALEPDIAQQEADNLIQADKLSVLTPKLLACDAYAEVTEYPSLVMTKVPGSVQLLPDDQSKWVHELARILSEIHSENQIEVSSSYFRYTDPSHEIRAEWSMYPELWKRAFTILDETKPASYKSAFIHRDFHPTNVLFQKDKAVAVVDWPNGCMGPKSFDVAHCRWNLAVLYGTETADAFLKAYLSYSKVKHYDYYWDLEALLNIYSEEKPEVYKGWETYGVNPISQECLIKRTDQFLKQALAQVEKKPLN